MQTVRDSFPNNSTNAATGTASSTSEISTFADAVVAFLVDDQVEQRRFEAEELRQLLVQRGMIAGNELIWNMPKALAKDGRFAWDADGKYVAVKV